MYPKLCKDYLSIRAQALKKVRVFFERRDVMEVDTPLLSQYAPIDPYIDVFEVKDRGLYLHTSPEYGMKVLLSNGVGSIYQMGHVFRDGECGPLHRSEFMMIEWYRVGKDHSFNSFIQENLDLVSLFLNKLDCEWVTYDNVFGKYIGVGCDADKEVLMGIAHEKGIVGNDFDPIVALWGNCVEKQLGNDVISVVTNFPKEQAALSQISPDGHGTDRANRFEIFFQGIEIGNGYLELQNFEEHLIRFKEWNDLRIAMGKDGFDVDIKYLQAIERGLPNCCGCALGFDRLLMCSLGLHSIDCMDHFLEVGT